jgi:hypothetical protein
MECWRPKTERGQTHGFNLRRTCDTLLPYKRPPSNTSHVCGFISWPHPFVFWIDCTLVDDLQSPVVQVRASCQVNKHPSFHGIRVRIVRRYAKQYLRDPRRPLNNQTKYGTVRCLGPYSYSDRLSYSCPRTLFCRLVPVTSLFNVWPPLLSLLIILKQFHASGTSGTFYFMYSISRRPRETAV